MPMTDPIADFLTRIRNSQLAKRPELTVPYSKFKYALAQLLEREGWLTGIAVIDNNRSLKLLLKYHHEQPVINELERVSRPGRRVYVSHADIPRVRNGFGMAVISTSRGLLTDTEARKSKLGGEIICQIS